MRKTILGAASLGVAGALAVCALTCPDTVDAADHNDPPPASGTLSDIGDLYAWHDGDAGTMTVVVTVGGGAEPGSEQDWRADVLYRIHIDNDDVIATDEALIELQLGQNGAGDWGVRATGLPGTTGELIGPVDTHNSLGSAHVYAGLFEDPFFFDLEGFTEILVDIGATGDADLSSFVATRDSLAGTNARALVVEFALADATGTHNPRVWASTHRLPQ